MRELLGEPRSVDCKVGISDQIGLELLPALRQQLGRVLLLSMRLGYDEVQGRRCRALWGVGIRSPGDAGISAGNL
jgi:hypothetical protein